MILSATLPQPRMEALAAALARLAQTGDCFALYGDLGAGKSSFARAFIKTLTNAAEVPSPSFTLVQPYEGPACPLVHYDLYRLKNPQEVYELGWDDLGSGISLIEWPQRAEKLLPPAHLAIRLEFAQHGASRLVTLDETPAWASRLLPLHPHFKI